MNTFVDLLPVNVIPLKFNLKNACLHKFFQRRFIDYSKTAVFNLINTTKNTFDVESARFETPSVLTHHRLHDKCSFLG
jgi:hypothetical protein